MLNLVDIVAEIAHSERMAKFDATVRKNLWT